MKKLLSIVLFVIMTVTQIPNDVLANNTSGNYGSGVWGTNLTWNLDAEGNLTISGTGEMQEADWYSYPWCNYADIIKTVTIQPGITSIAKNAFNSRSMTSVSLPASLTVIGEDAFSYCGIEKLTLPNGLKTIEGNAFRQTKIKSLDIPASVETIGGYAFSEIEIKSLTVPATVKKAGYNVFFDCDSLTSVTISKGVTAIADGMFNNCSKLKTVKMPDTVKTIGYASFCNTPIKKITIPKSVTKIKTYAFNNCRKLKSMKLPKTVKTIGKYAVGYKETGPYAKQVVMKGFVLKGKKKSAAWRYAKKNKIKFKSVKK